ncbi:hypothetical protein BN871_LI_00040 [Paenibacillus sp. P22]|nr:hypothetical protein BN871_LI_00040 [Paenibacillus sp. P22]
MPALEAGLREVADLVMLVSRSLQAIDEMEIHLQILVLGRQRQLVALVHMVEERVLLHLEAVERVMRQIELQSLVDAVGQHRDRLLRQAEHQVDGQVAEARRPRIVQAAVDVVHVVDAADPLQKSVVERLDTKAQPIDPAREHDRKLVRIGRAGIGLHREFRSLVQREMLPYGGKESLHLRRSQHRRSASSHEYRIDALGRNRGQSELHLLFQRGQIAVDRLTLQHIGVEVAVKAFVRAKRDMNVKRLGRVLQHGDASSTGNRCTSGSLKRRKRRAAALLQRSWRPNGQNAHPAYVQSSILVDFQDGHERLLRNLDVADLLHPFLAFLLLLEQLALPADVAAVAFGKNVFAHRLDRLARNDLLPDRRLDWHLEHLARNQILELLADDPSALIGAVAVHDDGQGVDRLAVQHDIHLHQLGLAVAGQLVVEGSVPLRAGFQLVEEVVDDLRKRNLVRNGDAVRIQVLHVHEFAALVLAQLHDGADKVVRHDDGGLDIRLLDMLDLADLRVVGRIVDAEHLAARKRHGIDDARRRRDEVDVELALDALLDDVHMEQAQESAAEAEAERCRRFRLEGEGRVVELQLLQRLAQVVVLRVVDRIQAAVYHRVDLAVARKRLGSLALGFGHRVADARVLDILDAGDDEADISYGKLVHDAHARLEGSDLDDLEFSAGRHEVDLGAGLDAAVDDAHVDDDALVRIVVGVEDQRLERLVGISRRSGNLLDDLLQNLLDADARLGGSEDGVARVEPDDILDLLLDPLRLRARQVDLVDDRKNLQVVVQRQIDVGQRLGLDALGRVHDQQRALAGREAAGNFIREVDVSGRIDQVQDVLFPVVGLVAEAHGLQLDGDAALALEIHLVEHLRLHFAGGQCSGIFQNTVGQRRLPVVNMRDNGKIPYLLLAVAYVCHA